MKSLRGRMFTALGLVIAVAWAIPIAMLASYLTAGESSTWQSGLHAIGRYLAGFLPADWSPSSAAAGTHRYVKMVPAASGTSSGPESILTAMVLNTVEMVVVGLLTWLAVVVSLRPLRTLSDGIRARQPFDSTPLPNESVPTELRPLIEAFNSLLARVDAAMHAERQFIADAAHELRTPLAALHVHAEVALKADTLQRKDDAIRKLLEVSNRTHRLADQLLDLARLDAGLHATGRQQIDLMTLSRHVIDEFTIRADARGTRLILAGSPCFIRGDVDDIGVLLRNLIDNGLRHGKEQGVIEVRCGQEGQASAPFIEVCDDGPGIPIDEHAAVFRRFYRASGAATPGSGIGLSLVAGIAALHGGSIDTGVGSAGRGFRIRVTFPPLINS